MQAFRLLYMLFPGLLLLGWVMWSDSLPCVGVLLLMLPVLALIVLNMLEVALLRRRALVGMYLEGESWLSRLMCRKAVLFLWQVTKATVLVFILFVEALDWPPWFWLLLLLDIPVLFFTSHRLEQSLQGQVKAGAQGIIARRLLVTVNTLILALLLAGGWMFEPQTDYRDMSWQATAVYAAQQEQLHCELLAPLARTKAVQQALVERLVRQGLEMLTNTWGKLAGWLLFFFWSGLSLWAWSRMLLAPLIQKVDLDRLMHKGCHLG